METNSKELKFAVLAVDVVVFTVLKDQLHVLVIKIGDGDFKGYWAVPGGMVLPNESLEDAFDRHLRTKTNIDHIYCEQLYTFGRIDRDPRGRVVSVAYMALIPPNNLALKTTDKYEAITWMPVTALPQLAYDHNEIVDTAVERLMAKLEYTNVVYSLLPEEFSLSQLQAIYEIILGRVLDKRNFRKKVLSLGLITKLDKKKFGEPNRPAQLFRFREKQPQMVDIL